MDGRDGSAAIWRSLFMNLARDARRWERRRGERKGGEQRGCVEPAEDAARAHAEQAERPADDSEWEPQEPADDAEYREQYADHDEGGETERCEYDQLDHFRTSGTGPLRRRTPAGPGNSVQWVPRRVAPSGFVRPCWTACCRTPLDSLTSAPVPRPGRRRLLECQ